MKETDRFKDLCLDGRIIFRWALKYDRMVWSGLIWLSVETCSGLL